MKIPIEETRNCLHFRLRRITRLISRHFDQALRPLGLSVAHFNILAALAQLGPIPVTKLAKVLGLERSAVARNLKLIARDGLVLLSEGEDRRTLVAEISRLGRKKLDQALPNWKRAQDHLIAKVGASKVARALETLAKLRAALKE